MSMIHGGRVVAKALKNEGITHIFTLCGGHVQNIYDGCLDEGIRIVDVRHEQTAAHAADGWARITGQPGVAVVTAGPGVTDSVTGVANAFRAQVPMVLIGGQSPRFFQDMGGLQDMNHVELMRPITKWSVSVPETARLGEYLQSAFRIATTGVPGPVFLEMPLDLLMNSVEESQAVFYPGYRTPYRPEPDREAVEAAARLIRRARKPVLIVGSQWWWSRRREGLQAFLRAAAVPVFLNGMARGALPPDHANLFVQSRGWAVAAADLVIIFGTPLDFRLGYGREPKFNEKARVIQVDLDGGEIGRNRSIEVGIVGDSGLTLDSLAGALGSRADFRDWNREVREVEERLWSRIDSEAATEGCPVNALAACRILTETMGEEAIIVGDGGDFLGTAAKIIRMAKPGRWMDPGPLGTLGVGPGYAMAAKLARPEARVIIVYGDGSFALNGFEFESMARQNIKVTGVIGNDAAWSQIRRGQIALFGRERAVATRLDCTRYEQVVAPLGCHGEYVEHSSQLRPALERAFASDKPAVVNIMLAPSDFRSDAISV